MKTGSSGIFVGCNILSLEGRGVGEGVLKESPEDLKGR